MKKHKLPKRENMWDKYPHVIYLRRSKTFSAIVCALLSGYFIGMGQFIVSMCFTFLMTCLLIAALVMVDT